MKIKYIPACHDKIKTEGEIDIFFNDNDEVVTHHDLSDGSLELDYFSDIMKAYGVEIEFVSIEKPTKKQIKAANKYLKEIYG